MSSRSANTIKFVLLLASTMTVMSGAIIAPGLTSMAADFPDFSEEWIKLVLAMPALMIGLFAGLIGRISDRYGRIRLLVLCLILYAVAGVSGYFWQQLPWLLASRAGLGLGVAGIMSLSTSLIGDYFEGEERKRFMGTHASVMAFGGMVFLLLGGYLAELSWRVPFLLYGLGLLVFPIVWSLLPEPDRTPTGKEDTQVTGRANQGIVYLIFGVGFSGMTFFYMLPTQLPFLMEETLQIAGRLVGIALAVVTLTAAISSAFYGRVKSRLSYPMVFVLGFMGMGSGYVLLSLLQTYEGIMAGLAVAGFGAGFLIPNCNLWLMELTPVEQRGQAIGTLSSMYFFGQFSSPLLVGLVLPYIGIPLAFRGASILMVLLSLSIGVTFWSRTKR